ncbi:MAG: DUF1501 domain-containing protein, partial [Verrucomicrobiota bacterium]
MITRRQVIERAAQSAFGLSVLAGAPSGVRAAAEAQSGAGFGSAKRVIYLNVRGGMSQIDTFDPKTLSGVKGPGEAISTSADFQVTHYLEKTAKVADQLALIRTMSAKIGVHGPAQYFMRTGFPERNTIKHPNLGAWAQHYLGQSHSTLPSSACINQGPRYGNGFFPTSYSPIPILEPSAGLANVKTEKGASALQEKLDLAHRLSSDFVNKYQDSNVSAYREFYDNTIRLLRSEDLSAFDISKESDAMRASYGADRFGQGCLLARRLVEAGIRFVEVASDGWDMHSTLQNDMAEVAPRFDQGLSALITDLKERGMLDDTLVVIATEFGRKPGFNGGGRGHYPTAFTVGLAGAGVKRGFVYGDSGEKGDSPDKPVTVGDFHATIAHAAGMPIHEEYVTSTGRPFVVGGEKA